MASSTLAHKTMTQFKTTHLYALLTFVLLALVITCLLYTSDAADD